MSEFSLFGRISKPHTPGLFYWLMIFWVAAIIIGFIAASFGKPFLVPDSGFYLKIAHDLNEGASYFKDMEIAYNPFGIYFFSLVFHFFPNISLPLLYTFILLLNILSAYLLYKILARFDLDFYTRMILTLLSLLAIYICEGYNILLEPFTLVFQLFAVFLVLERVMWKSEFRLLLIGVICFLAFFSKQYGLSVIVAIIWFMYLEKSTYRRFVYDVSVIGIGFFLPFVIVVAFFNLKGVNIGEMLIRLLGIEFLAGRDQVTGIGYNFPRFLESVGRFISETPIILILIPLVIFRKKHTVSSRIVFMIVLILSSCVQLIFAGYRHYYQLIAPYCFLLIGALIINIEPSYLSKVKAYFSILCVLFLLMGSYKMVKTYNKRDRLQKFQEIDKATLTKYVPPKQKVYIQGISPAFYFLCKYDSPNPKKLGYRFSEELEPGYICRNIPSKAFLISDTGFIKNKDLLADYIELHRVLLSGGKECIILQKR